MASTSLGSRTPRDRVTAVRSVRSLARLKPECRPPVRGALPPPSALPHSRPKESPSPPRLCRLHLTDRFRFAKRPKSIYFSTNESAGNGRDGVWATRVTSGARPVLVDAGGRRGRRAGEGRGEEGREGEVVRGRPGGWVLGKASSFNTSPASSSSTSSSRVLL